MFRSFVRGNKNFHCWHPVVKFEVIAQSWCFYRLPFIGFLFGTLIDDLFKAVVGNNHMSACLEERVRCRARPSGGINTHSHPHTQTELRRDCFFLFFSFFFFFFLLFGLESGFIFTPIYQPDCSSDPRRLPPLPGVYILWSCLPTEAGEAMYITAQMWCFRVERDKRSERTRVSGECWIQWGSTWI